MSITYRLNLVFFLILLFSSCTTNRLNELEQNINKLDYNHENYSISLDTISFFEWDEVVIAGPYVSLSNINGYNFKVFPSNATDYDQYIFMGFILEKEGVKWVSPKRNEYLDSLYKSDSGYKIYKKSSASFQLRKKIE